jgi:hypothetical protein
VTRFLGSPCHTTKVHFSDPPSTYAKLEHLRERADVPQNDGTEQVVVPVVPELGIGLTVDDTY